MKKQIFFVLVLILLSGCDKEGHSFRQNKFEVEFGNYSNMNLTLVDTVLIGSYNRPEFIKYDLDGDKIDDIGFESTVWGSPAIGGHPKATIFCLHEDAKLLGYQQNDTSFLNTYIRIDNGQGGIVEIYENINVSCHRIDESDSILNIAFDNFKLETHLKSEEFSPEDLFRSDTIVIATDSYSYPIDQINICEDSTKYISRSFINGCDDLPQDKICYLGLKILDGKKETLGWIKISISNQYKIHILETAVQKN